jgi:hypothetical protein
MARLVCLYLLGSYDLISHAASALSILSITLPYDSNSGIYPAMSFTSRNCGILSRCHFRLYEVTLLLATSTTHVSELPNSYSRVFDSFGDLSVTIKSSFLVPWRKQVERSTTWLYSFPTRHGYFFFPVRTGFSCLGVLMRLPCS